MTNLTPLQLQIISDEYYVNGYVLGRDKLTEHLRDKYPQEIFNPKSIMEWLRYQPTHSIHQRQRKPKQINSFKPIYPMHSFSIDLIDYSKNGSTYTDPTNTSYTFYYILVIIDNYSRFMWAYPMESKMANLTAYYVHMWYTTQYMGVRIAPPAFFQFDNGGEFQMMNTYIEALPCNTIRSIPHVPQSNSLVERSIGKLKRIMSKLIHIRHQSYISIQANQVHGNRGALRDKVLWQQWHMELDKSIHIYNNMKHSTTEEKPVDAISIYNVSVDTIKQRATDNGINNAILYVNYPLRQLVRKLIHKGQIGKHDKNTFSQEVYIIIARRNVNANRQTKYFIQQAHPDQITHPNEVVGEPENHYFYREHLNPINV